MSQVFVLDAHKQALNPIHPGRARLLLKAGKAAVYRRYPFTIILARVVEQPTLHPLRLLRCPRCPARTRSCAAWSQARHGQGEQAAA
jgi:hypothetical protein